MIGWLFSRIICFVFFTAVLAGVFLLFMLILSIGWPVILEEFNEENFRYVISIAGAISLFHLVFGDTDFEDEMDEQHFEDE